MRDRTFDEVVAGAWQVSIKAEKYAYYDAAACHELIAKVSSDRGTPIETACFFNDRRTQSRAAADRTPSPADLGEALPLTVRRWGRRWDWYDGLFFLHIDEAEDAIHYTAWTDTHHLSPAGLEEFARQFEAVVVDAAFDATAAAYRG